MYGYNLEQMVLKPVDEWTNDKGRRSCHVVTFCISTVCAVGWKGSKYALLVVAPFLPRLARRSRRATTQQFRASRTSKINKISRRIITCSKHCFVAISSRVARDNNQVSQPKHNRLPDSQASLSRICVSSISAPFALPWAISASQQGNRPTKTTSGTPWTSCANKRMRTMLS